jgi:hypothetical protein
MNTCGCGCGGRVSPTTRFLAGHANRLRASNNSSYRRCTHCGNTVRVRQDGTLGSHLKLRGRAARRAHCPAAGQPRVHPGQRITVMLDVVLPDGWTAERYRRCAEAALREHLGETRLLAINAVELEESG